MERRAPGVLFDPEAVVFQSIEDHINTSNLSIDAIPSIPS
jgi:hypothetical protein